MSRAYSWVVVVLIAAAPACGRLGFDAEPAHAAGDSGVDAPGACGGATITQLFTGHRTTCFIDGSGGRWCTGDGAGIGSSSPTLAPTHVPGDDGWTSFDLGWGKSAGIKDAQTWTWTSVTPPAIANGSAGWTQISYDLDDYCYLENTQLACDENVIQAPGLGGWIYADAGDASFCAIAANHSLYCWGTDQSNVLGLGVEADGTNHPEPVPVGTDTDWAAVAISANLACARKLDGTLWCWGAAGSTGTNGVDTRGVPTQISMETDWTAFDVRWDHACASKPDGHPWCWGHDEYGLQVVPGTSGDVLVPTDTGYAWDEFHMGGHHQCGRTGDRWLCFGINQFGELGTGDTTDQQTPGAALCAP